MLQYVGSVRIPKHKAAARRWKHGCNRVLKFSESRSTPQHLPPLPSFLEAWQRDAEAAPQVLGSLSNRRGEQDELLFSKRLRHVVRRVHWVEQACGAQRERIVKLMPSRRDLYVINIQYTTQSETIYISVIIINYDDDRETKLHNAPPSTQHCTGRRTVTCTGRRRRPCSRLASHRSDRDRDLHVHWGEGASRRSS